MDLFSLAYDAASDEAPEGIRRSRGELEIALSRHAGFAVRVTLTDNGRVMLSARKEPGGVHARLHHMFVFADDETLAAVAQHFRRRTSKARRVVGAFIAEHGHRIERRARRIRPRTGGVHHDLAVLFDELNRECFAGAVTATVTWGARNPQRRRNSIRFGTYAERDHLIRIHPALDADWVPDYVVRNVLFHEMLHAVMPARIAGERKIFHTREFRARERAFPDYERASAWERENLGRLLDRPARSAAAVPRSKGEAAPASKVAAKKRRWGGLFG